MNVVVFPYLATITILWCVSKEPIVCLPPCYGFDIYFFRSKEKKESSSPGLDIHSVLHIILKDEADCVQQIPRKDQKQQCVSVFCSCNFSVSGSQP